MKILPGLFRSLALVWLISSTLAFGCDDLVAGQTLWIRLISPVSSYDSKPGDAVHAVLTEAAVCDSQLVLPVGTRIDGVVHSVRKVGWGIRHETAALDIRFDRASVAQDASVPIAGVVQEVENAREQISKGVVEGIRSSDSPEGRITSRIRHLPTLNPYSDLGLIVYKATFPIFPEPEIYLPAGTDLRIKLTKASQLVLPEADREASNIVQPVDAAKLEQLPQDLPQRSTTLALVNADVVNLVFLGSREQVEAAFRQAGWSPSDAFNRRSFLRDFYSFLNNSAYAQAPMRSFLLNGKPADMNWEKTLNSYARRDHLRIWQWPEAAGSESLWVSSSTHDTGATLSLKRHQFVHHIAPDIDEERSKVIRDLEVEGCVKAVSLQPRPDVPNLTENANGDLVRTNGALAIVELKACQPIVPGPASTLEEVNFKPGNRAFRYLRKQILTFRSDIWRANIIYSAYDVGRMTVEAWRHHEAAAAQREADAAAFAALQ